MRRCSARVPRLALAHRHARPRARSPSSSRSIPKQPTLFIIGAVHIAESLCQLARPLGYRTVVADGRAAFLTRERFPDVDLLVQAWPEDAFQQVGVDDATCICVLSHDPKFDEPALDAALRSPAAYVGAIGSRKTQEIRRERLRERGIFTGGDRAVARSDRIGPGGAAPGRDRARHSRGNHRGPARRAQASTEHESTEHSRRD